MLASNIERQGFSNVVVTNEYPDRLAARWGETFDAVRVDAPCSGEGNVPPRRGSRAPVVIRRAAHVSRAAGGQTGQRDGFRPGGAMVYSTCTFNRLENEQSVAEFMRRHPDMLAEDFALAGIGESQGGMLRIWPHRVNGEGHFVCRMRKQGEYTERPTGKRDKHRRAGKGAPVDAEGVLKRLKSTIDLPDIPGTPVMYGQRLYMLPEGCPELDGVKVARAGLEMCEAGRSHVEPAYALGRALAPDKGAVEGIPPPR